MFSSFSVVYKNFVVFIRSVTKKYAELQKKKNYLFKKFIDECYFYKIRKCSTTIVNLFINKLIIFVKYHIHLLYLVFLLLFRSTIHMACNLNHERD
jgi:hypothetical protein